MSTLTTQTAQFVTATEPSLLTLSQPIHPVMLSQLFQLNQPTQNLLLDNFAVIAWNISLLEHVDVPGLSGFHQEADSPSL